MTEIKKIGSVAEFLNSVYTKANQTNNDDKPDLFWFRGESDIDFETPLVPNGYRELAKAFNNNINDFFKSEDIKKIEQNITAEFYRKAFPYMVSKGIENSAWNRYYLMQHYDIYTRLLDWTENALIALFFSVIDNTTKDAKVWILRPFNLNDYTINNIISSEINYLLIPTTVEKEKQKLIDDKGKIRLNELTRRYLRMDFDEEDNLSNVYYPLALYPSYLDERMVAQKSCFTIFGNKINGLSLSNTKKSEILDSIIVDGKSKVKILDELAIIGIDYHTIYPDISGLGKAINNRYKPQFHNILEALPHIFAAPEQ